MTRWSQFFLLQVVQEKTWKNDAKELCGMGRIEKQKSVLKLVHVYFLLFFNYLFLFKLYLIFLFELKVYLVLNTYEN
jgi:hypothetical protein